MSRKKRRMRRYINQFGPYCYWCKQIMMTGKYKSPLPANLATFEHLDDRLSSRRGTFVNTIRTVVACRICNQLRGMYSKSMLNNKWSIESYYRYQIRELHRHAIKYGPIDNYIFRLPYYDLSDDMVKIRFVTPIFNMLLMNKKGVEFSNQNSTPNDHSVAKSD